MLIELTDAKAEIYGNTKNESKQADRIGGTRS
jgi:hypothetical protein